MDGLSEEDCLSFVVLGVGVGDCVDDSALLCSAWHGTRGIMYVADCIVNLHVQADPLGSFAITGLSLEGAQWDAKAGQVRAPCLTKNNLASSAFSPQNCVVCLRFWDGFVFVCTCTSVDGQCG